MKKEDLVPVGVLAFILALCSIVDQLWGGFNSNVSPPIICFLTVAGNIPLSRDKIKNRVLFLTLLSLLILTSSTSTLLPWKIKILYITILFVYLLSIDYLLRKKESSNPEPIHPNDTILTPDDFALLGVFAILVSIVTLIESYVLPSIFTNPIPHGLAFGVVILMGNIILKTATSYRKFIQCCFMTLIVGTTASISAHYTWSQIIAISGSLSLAILLIDFLLYKFKKPVGLSNTEAS